MAKINIILEYLIRNISNAERELSYQKRGPLTGPGMVR